MCGRELGQGWPKTSTLQEAALQPCSCSSDWMEQCKQLHVNIAWLWTIESDQQSPWSKDRPAPSIGVKAHLRSWSPALSKQSSKTLIICSGYCFSHLTLASGGLNDTNAIPVEECWDCAYRNMFAWAVLYVTWKNWIPPASCMTRIWPTILKGLLMTRK